MRLERINQKAVLSSQFSVEGNPRRNDLSTSSCTLDGRDQSVEHLSQFRRLVEQGLGLPRIQITEVLSNRQLSLNFHQRTSRMAQKVTKLLLREVGLAFCDIAGYRNGGP